MSSAMRKHALLYTISFILLVLIIVFLNKTHREIKKYSILTNTHNTVHNYFQSLSIDIHKAAVFHPGLLRTGASFRNGMFYIDSAAILRQLVELKSSVRDSINTRLAARLDTLIPSEIGWLLLSDVPDSIMMGRGGEHIVTLKAIDSLLTKGIERTIFLMGYQKDRLDYQTRQIKYWIFFFVILSGGLLIYTVINLFRQRSRVREKERELETALNRMSDAVISVDNNWRCTFLNDAAMADMKEDKSKVIGKMIWEIQVGLKETGFWPKYQEARLLNKETGIEDFNPVTNSWLFVKVYPSENGLTLFCRDVSAGKRAEQQLSQTLKELTDYKVALDESSIVAITDQKGIIRHANENFCKISKFSLEELIGQDHRIINSGYHSKEFIRSIWTTIANGRIWKGELKNRAKDGTVYWVDTTIVPFLDEKGKPFQYVAIRADITERKAAEERIIKSEKIYKTIASSIPGSVICLFDLEYRYLLIEGDMLEKLGYSKQDLLGNRASEVLKPEVFGGIRNDFDRGLAGEAVTRETHRSGYDLVTRVIPLKDEDNKVYALMTVALDVTDLKRAQRNISELNKNLEEKIKQRTLELKKSNEELEAFSYSVSHDLRAPLRGIIGFTAILEEDYGRLLDDEGKRITSIIKYNTSKMGQLIDDLLAFSRLGKKEIIKTNSNMGMIVADIVNEFSADGVVARPVEWIIHPLPHAHVDLNMIRQVWVNLISNAVKYSSSKEKPSIEIGSFPKGDQSVFYVNDNGVGFNEQYRHKLFKVFQRLHNVEDFEGTGIGLALVEKIVSKHGGEVWAEGTENEGACFYFSLPVS